MKDIIKNIIDKIKEFLKNIRTQKTTKKLPIIEQNNNEENKKIEKQNPINEMQEVKKLNNNFKEEEKQRIFNIYNKIREEKINLNQIEYKDLIKIRELLKEEVKIQSKKLEQEAIELKSLEAN